jgi:O-acetyl-ADP-ribose deacetylase
MGNTHRRPYLARRRKGGRLLASFLLQESLELSRDYGIKTIDFPAISTGAYGFPSERAAGIAVSDIKKFLQESELPETVFPVYSNTDTCRLLQNALQKAMEI